MEPQENDSFPNKIETVSNFFLRKKRWVVLIAGFIASLAALLGNITSIKNFFTPKPETLSFNGVVINPNNSPAAQAKVSLFLWSSKVVDSFKTFADGSGAFTFTGLQKRNYDSVRIETSFKSKHVSYQIKLDKVADNYVSGWFKIA